jgi:hypothetical protein
MRIFEALASGALLVTNKISNGIDDIFVEGLDYISYSSKEEAIIKINYYLNNKNALNSIAKSGNHKAILRHTYSLRWQKIYSILTPFEPKTRRPTKLIDSYSFIYMRFNRPLLILKCLNIYGVSFFSIKNFCLCFVKYFAKKIF